MTVLGQMARAHARGATAPSITKSLTVRRPPLVEPREPLPESTWSPSPISVPSVGQGPEPAAVNANDPDGLTCV